MYELIHLRKQLTSNSHQLHYRMHFWKVPMILNWVNLSLVVIHLSAYVCGSNPAHRVVVTTQGTVRGYYVPRPPHHAFLGLPYARPPTRRDRFKAPKPPESWTGVFEAIHRVKCPQPDGSGEENCLVLNVFTPVSAASLPVVVHFHDGGFQRGWGSFKGPERLLDQGFVTVTFNYRLGVLGFLCLGLEEVPGNAGLKDQVAALYWVQRNIAKFGGNSSDITVYGTGSGAASIDILLLSGQTKELFHKVILESGSALSPSSITHYPYSDSFDVASYLGYEGKDDPISLSNFYYKLPIKKITNTSKNFLPCLEKDYYSTHSLLNTDPRDILKSGQYHHVSMMVVYSNAEQVSIISENIAMFKTVPEHFENLLPNNLAYNSNYIKNKLAKLVKDFYFNEVDSAENVVQSYVDYVNDIFLIYPLINSIAHHARERSVFLMKYIYKNQLSKNSNFSIHGDAHDNVFQYIMSTRNLEDPDEIIVETIMTLLTNFIRLRDPTPLTTELVTEIWQPIIPYVLDGKVILHKINCLVFGKSMRNEEISGQQLIFWDEIYEKFYINTED